MGVDRTNFTNKYGETKMVYRYSHNPKLQYTQTALSTSIRRCIPVFVLHFKSLLYLFYYSILQLIQHVNFYFNIQHNKIIWLYQKILWISPLSKHHKIFANKIRLFFYILSYRWEPTGHPRMVAKIATRAHEYKEQSKSFQTNLWYTR